MSEQQPADDATAWSVLADPAEERLRWFQQREDSRHWRIVNLPGS